MTALRTERTSRIGERLIRDRVAVDRDTQERAYKQPKDRCDPRQVGGIEERAHLNRDLGRVRSQRSSALSTTGLIQLWSEVEELGAA